MCTYIYIYSFKTARLTHASTAALRVPQATLCQDYTYTYVSLSLSLSLSIYIYRERERREISTCVYTDNP